MGLLFGREWPSQYQVDKNSPHLPDWEECGDWHLIFKLSDPKLVNSIMLPAKNPLPSCVMLSALAHILCIVALASLSSNKLDLQIPRISPIGEISLHLSQPKAKSNNNKQAITIPKKVAPPITKTQKAIAPSPIVNKKVAPVKVEQAAQVANSAIVTNENTTQESTVESGSLASGQGSKARTSYESVLANWLERYRVYPSRALRRRITGEGVLYVSIDQRGKVLNFKLQQSTNNPMLDEAIINMLNKAAPLPAIPKAFKTSKFEFIVPITFKIE